jgi:hypothetical protein
MFEEEFEEYASGILRRSILPRYLQNAKGTQLGKKHQQNPNPRPVENQRGLIGAQRS